MKVGLVLEGGAMRGMFTAGVLDVLLENEVAFEGAVGVSAGAVFGCNYKSKQIGRTIRYNKKYCKDPRYVSLRSLLKTGNIYGTDFAYRDLPEKLDVFDTKTYLENDMEFYVVCTDVDTGKPLYHLCEDCGERDLLYMRGSASMPLLSRYAEVDGYRLSDGGTADSIPIRFFESLGYARNLVILTQPQGFLKRPNSFLPLMRIALRKDKALLKALETRHIHYNETLRYLESAENEGTVFVIRPEAPLKIGAVSHNPEELERVYQIGRATMQRKLDEFLAWKKESETIS